MVSHLTTRDKEEASAARLQFLVSKDRLGIEHIAVKVIKQA